VLTAELVIAMSDTLCELLAAACLLGLLVVFYHGSEEARARLEELFARPRRDDDRADPPH